MVPPTPADVDAVPAAPQLPPIPPAADRPHRAPDHAAQDTGVAEVGHINDARAPAPPAAPLPTAPFMPARARYFDLIDHEFRLLPDEVALLEHNGFLLSDRLAFPDFSTAYAYLHWKDLPVLITTDSLLHAIHETSADLLIFLECGILFTKLTTLLRTLLTQVRRAARANQDPLLVPLYADLVTYLAVPLALLEEDAGLDDHGSAVAPYLALVNAAAGTAEVALFGAPRPVDFTLFQPRGHYADDPAAEPSQGLGLTGYFRAMTWLAQIDFRLVSYTPGGHPVLQPTHLAAAMLLRDAIERAGAHAVYQAIETLVSAFVGHSDNTTLADFERFLVDADLHAPTDVLAHRDPARLLALLTSGAYGQQQITGQWLEVHQATPKPIPQPVSFLLLGARFVEDSAITSALVYDQLLVNGRKVPRALPSPLDVWAALGNDRALVHLEDELARYGYEETLTALRQAVDQVPPAFWEGTLYHRFLHLLRTLAVDTRGPGYPAALRTTAWADKMLHTQLAGWTQLRHDTLLYVKQSVTAIPICEYPAGYVEPYPAFYAALADYAATGRALVAALDATALDEIEQEQREAIVDYFEHLGTVAGQLHTIAEKELRGEPVSQEEEAFLKQTASRHVRWVDPRCADLVAVEEWGGWYPRLMPWREGSPVLIADIHTNPSGELDGGRYPPCVLHVATGPVALALLVVETEREATLYAGPAYTYYEVVEAGLPLKRLTDAAWQARLARDGRPAAPGWVGSFRLPATEQPQERALPRPERPPGRRSP